MPAQSSTGIRLRELAERRQRMIASLLESRAAALEEIQRIDQQLQQLKYRAFIPQIYEGHCKK